MKKLERLVHSDAYIEWTYKREQSLNDMNRSHMVGMVFLCLEILLVFSWMFLYTPAEAKEVHIAVIDSGYSNNIKDLVVCKNGTINLTGKGDMTDISGHGTAILKIISNELKEIDYCVYIFKIYEDGNVSPFLSYYNALVLSYYKDIDIINYSSVSYTHSLVEDVLVTGLMVQKKVKFVAAVGNDNHDLDKDCDAHPACLDGVISVGSTKYKHSNYGKIVKQWEPGYICVEPGKCWTGSSMAAAEYTSKLAKQLYKQK